MSRPSGNTTWPLLCLAVEALGQHWVSHLSFLLPKKAQQMLHSPCSGSFSGTVGSFQSGQGFAGWRTLTIVSSKTGG